MREIKLLMFVILILGLIVMQPGTVKRVAADCGDPECQMPQGGCPGGVWAGEPNCECLESPIIIDLNNDGYNLTNAANGVRFDLRGDGKTHPWSWTARGSDDAFLALDRNGDGRITSGKELFGNNTEQPVSEEPNGFTALRVFDQNDDGWINEKDVVHQKLLLWVDANHDGVSQRQELQPLKPGKVEGVSLDYKLSKRSDRHGNQFKFKALARISGIERWVWDIFLLPGK
jgi:hypothetical protein